MNVTLNGVFLLSHLLMNAVQGFGYSGIFIAMVLESACIPIPSEVVMPFGGYLVVAGHLNFWTVVITGTLGNVVGSLIAYYIGLYGGRPVILRYGRYVRISEKHLQKAETWFAKRGEVTVLIGRMLPIVRTFISLPAGISRMSVGRFVIYTAAGSLPWVYMLTWAGTDLGSHWEHIARFMHPFTYIVAAAIILLIVLYILKRRRRSA